MTGRRVLSAFRSLNTQMVWRWNPHLESCQWAMWEVKGLEMSIRSLNCASGTGTYEEEWDTFTSLVYLWPVNPSRIKNKNKNKTHKGKGGKCKLGGGGIPSLLLSNKASHEVEVIICFPTPQTSSVYPSFFIGQSQSFYFTYILTVGVYSYEHSCVELAVTLLQCQSRGILTSTTHWASIPAVQTPRAKQVGCDRRPESNHIPSHTDSKEGHIHTRPPSRLTNETVSLIQSMCINRHNVFFPHVWSC